MQHTSRQPSNVSFPQGLLSVLQHVWQWLRFLTTDRTFTNEPASLKAAAAADRDIDKTLPRSGRKMSPHLPSYSPRPGDLQPRPLWTSPQPASWAPSPCQETTNTNPFPEGRSQNQLLGVVFTNKAVLWGLRLRLGVEHSRTLGVRQKLWLAHWETTWEMLGYKGYHSKSGLFLLFTRRTQHLQIINKDKPHQKL